MAVNCSAGMTWFPACLLLPDSARGYRHGPFGAFAQGCAILHSLSRRGKTVMVKAARLDWDDLRYFLRAAQAKSLSAAARSLGVEHSTVGRRLSALERSLGAPLMLRGPDGLQLTPLGAKLASLVEQADHILSEIDDVVAADRPSVRLAVPSGFAGIFAAALNEPRATPVEFSLSIVSGARPADLKNGEADLAIRSGPIVDVELVAAKLCEAGFSLYASSAYLARRPAPSNPDSLAGHDVIGFDPSWAQSPPAQWLAQHTSAARIVIRSREMTDVRSAALSGIGLAILPCFLGDEEPALQRLTPQVLVAQSLSLVYRREARLSAPVRAAIRFIRAVVQRQRYRIIGIQS
jgi:DNA-binding transcriptional LysR family regulator